MSVTPRESTGYLPSPRIQRLREAALAGERGLPGAGWRHAYACLHGWMAAEGQPLPVRTAAALANVIETMPAVLQPGDILAGAHGFTGEMPVQFWWGVPGDLAEQLAAGPLTPAQQRELTGWLAGEPFRWKNLAPVAPYPAELQQAQEHGVVTVWGTALNHSIRGYEKVLRLGFSGLCAEVEEALHTLPLTDPDAAGRRANLLGWRRLCEAAMTLGSRHAEQARALAAASADPRERGTWQELADVCAQVPAGPARSFREAVQALWFAHMITVWEDGVNANGIGRIDQLLWPYLEQDLRQGALTREEAAEILAALWVKLYQSYDVQQMMIGGQHPDGSDATNPLSYLALDVTEGLGFIRCLSARLHCGSPRELLSRCVDLVAKGGGIPFFFNDDAIVPALVANGIPIEEARDYAAIGCIEITFPGKANPHAAGAWINLQKCLELALNDGCDLCDGVQLGPRTGTLAGCSDIEEVLAAYTRQLTYFMELTVYGCNSTELAHRAQFRLPYLSLLTDDCVARGRDIIEAGARYNYHSCAAMGIPNVADSLAALEHVVFNEARLTPAEMLQALRDNFTGRDDLRLFLRNRVPKYGNDQALPDAYAARIAGQFCTLLGRYRTASGGAFFAHLFTFMLMLSHGKLTGASPDGRLAGESFAYSLSPSPGRDREGLTAVINSLSRIPHHLVAAGSSAILEADPALFAGAGKAAFTDLLQTAIRQGVGQLQFNVVSADTLRDAQRDPERYRNLCVRVSGFSQQFGLLDHEMQEHIISRTKHRT